MSLELAEIIFTLYVGLFVIVGILGRLHRKEEDPHKYNPILVVIKIINLTAVLVIVTWAILAFSVSVSFSQFILRYGFLGIIPPLMAIHYEGWPMWAIDDAGIIIGVILTIILWFAGYIVWPVWIVLYIIFAKDYQTQEAS